MVESVREVAERIGEDYVENHEWLPPESTHSYDVTRRAFRDMADVNQEKFRDIPVPVEFQPDDPYRDYEDMKRTVAKEGKLRVFSGGNSHPIWSDHKEVVSRAVHDWYGHLSLDVDFSVVGEYQKWDHSRQDYPAHCDRVFFTEVIGQLGAVLYLEDGFSDPRFEQKCYPMDPKYIEQLSCAVEREIE